MSVKEKQNEVSTEQKILKAASKVFTMKGFDGAKTRDIAEEAGINLALLNYYFRSKEKLFQKVMMDKIQQMFGVIVPILMDETIEIDSKIDLATEKYLDFLSENPNLPLFILSEMQKDSSELQTVLPVQEIMMKNPSMMLQINERNPDIKPFHIVVNFISMTVFPFVAKGIFEKFGVLPQEEFKTFIDERRKLIPIWTKALLNIK